jgi:DNA-binding MarR family transcriptional regulator
MAIRAKRSQKSGAAPSRDPDDLPDCVCGMMRMVTRAVTQIYDDAMRPSGLRVTQFSLLSRIDRIGPVSAASLVDALHADQTTLARALKVLEGDGLIHRVPQADQRVKLIGLTAKGRKRVTEARRIWQQAQTQMIEAIGREQWQDMRLRLGGILGALGPARPGRAD